MKCRCLRICYVGDRIRNPGEVYDLPDGVEQSPKNFAPVEPVADVVVALEPSDAVTANKEEATVPPAEKEHTEPDPPAKNLVCPFCGKDDIKSKGGLKTHKKTCKDNPKNK